MCRFLLLTAPTSCDMRPLVVQFAQMCQHSTGLYGEGWQGDGWGVAWRDDHEVWQVQRSVAPIWTELDVHFISSLPVMQRPACTAWADKRHVQIV